MLAGGWGGNRFLGAYAVIDAALFVPAGVHTALIVPRRRRRCAQSYLATHGPGSPGSPSTSACGEPRALAGRPRAAPGEAAVPNATLLRLDSGHFAVEE